jgi:hypothetical protein
MLIEIKNALFDRFFTKTECRVSMQILMKNKQHISKDLDVCILFIFGVAILTKYKLSTMWLLGFETNSPRPQHGILTTKLQPLPH